jgi:hypothetical protein
MHHNDGQFAVGGAKSGALAGSLMRLDPDLQRVIDAWPTVPVPIRRAILALIGTALPETPGMPPKFAE